MEERAMTARLILILLVAGVAGGQTSSHFTTSGTCIACHSAIPYPSGAVRRADHPIPAMLRSAAKPAQGAVGPHTLWATSAMANAAVDPYWQARVRWEGRQHPTATAVIEDTCMHCHAPMQRYDAHAAGTGVRLSEMNGLGKDGVSCTLCHQILPDRLGTKESFTAEFVIDSEKKAFGPHANPFVNPMVMQSGYTPTMAGHVSESALCGSCHTVITPVLDAGGDIAGEFVEQAPYLEWLASEYPAKGASCQSCHKPRLQDSTGRNVAQYIATNPTGRYYNQTAPREPFGLHSFAGSNALLTEFMAALDPARAGAFEAAGVRAKESLAGALALQFGTRRDGDELKVDVTLQNLTGHKLPTGFPSRRLWVYLRVTDAQGETVFESGRPDYATGGIVGWNGDRAHRDEIEKSSEVAIYEAVLGDLQGQETKSLLSAAKLMKDNRILPAGFRANAVLPAGMASASIEPVGVSEDSDFSAGQDQVHYEMTAPAAKGPFTVAVEVLYQTIRPEEVSGFSSSGSSEEETFLRLFASRKAPWRVARREGVVR
jgi:hypothetical protein